MRTNRILVCCLLAAAMLLPTSFAFAGELRNASFTADFGAGWFHPFTKLPPHEKIPGNVTFGVNPGVSFEHLAFNLGLGYESFVVDEKHFVHQTKVQNLLVDFTVRWTFDSFVFDPVRLYIGGGLNTVFQNRHSPYLKTTRIGYEEALSNQNNNGFGPEVFAGMEVGNDNHAFFVQLTMDSYFGLPKPLVALRPTIGYRLTL